MEAYKRDLCSYFNSTSEEEIYNKVKDDIRYTCNLNEDGLLHSTYNGTYYEPAIIYKLDNRLNYYWMFDGKIKDYTHPFIVSTLKGQIERIEYYSSEIIKSNRPIFIDRTYGSGIYKRYNESFNYITREFTKILNDDRYKYTVETTYTEKFDKSMFTSELYPLFDEMEPRFKFVD